jgi:hypothetical protein
MTADIERPAGGAAARVSERLASGEPAQRRHNADCECAQCRDDGCDFDGDDGYDFDVASEALNAPRSRFEEMKLATQKRDLKLLCSVVRNSPLAFARWLRSLDIDPARLYEWGVLGDMTDFTVAEDECFATEAMGRKPSTKNYKGRSIKVRAEQFSRHLSPAGETEKQCKKRRRAFRRNMEREMDLQRAAASQPAPSATFHERRVADLYAVLPSADKAIGYAAAARKAKRRESFAGRKLSTVKQLVWEIVKTHPDRFGTKPARAGEVTMLSTKLSVLLSKTPKFCVVSECGPLCRSGFRKLPKCRTCRVSVVYPPRTKQAEAKGLASSGVTRCAAVIPSTQPSTW